LVKKRRAKPFFTKKGKSNFLIALIVIIISFSLIGVAVSNTTISDNLLIESTLNNLEKLFLAKEPDERNPGPEETTSPIAENVKKSKDEIPKKIIDSSDAYIKSFVGNEYYNQSIRFRKAVIHDPSIEGFKYKILYHLLLTYKDERGLDREYRLWVTVKLDEDGNVIDYIGPKKEYPSIIGRKEAIARVKQEDVSFNVEDLGVEFYYEDGFYYWKITSLAGNRSKLIDISK